MSVRDAGPPYYTKQSVPPYAQQLLEYYDSRGLPNDKKVPTNLPLEEFSSIWLQQVINLGGMSFVKGVVDGESSAGRKYIEMLRHLKITNIRERTLAPCDVLVCRTFLEEFVKLAA